MDRVVSELERLRMIGAWSEGTTLHIANSLMYEEPDLGFDEFDQTEQEWRALLDLREGRRDLDEQAYCLAGTISAVFAEVQLHGPHDRIAVIPVEHSLARQAD
jgi:hypothetical protein